MSTTAHLTPQQKDRREMVQCARALSCLLLLGVCGFPLYPIYKNAWTVRNRQPCQSNLKQLCFAIFLYSRDYNGHLPLIRSVGRGRTTNSPQGVPACGWADALLSYTRTTSLNRCLLDPSSLATKPPFRGYTSYYFNSHLNAPSRQRPHYHDEGMTFSQFTHPALTILLGEGSSGTARYNRASTEHQKRRAGWFSTDVPDERHLSNANYVFCDGHVKSMSRNVSASSRTQWHTTFVPY